MDFGSLTVLAVIVVLAVVIAISSIRIINEYERGVVFRLGRLVALKMVLAGSMASVAPTHWPPRTPPPASHMVKPRL